MKHDMNERNREAVRLPVDQLYPFARHPYQVRDDAEMEELAQSIRENGILSPVIVRPLENSENKYEIVSGHRRVRAAQKAGLAEIPAFVFEDGHISLDPADAGLIEYGSEAACSIEDHKSGKKGC